MRTRSIMLNLLTVPLMAQVSPVMNSDSKDVVPAFDSTGAITLPAARRKVDLVYPHGKKDRRELTVVYDPRTGHYLWHLTSSNPNIDDTGVYLKVIKKQEAVAYADPAGLIDFIFGNGLSAKVWQGQAASLDAALAASTSEVQQGLAVAEGRGYHLDYKPIPVFKNMSAAFYCEPLHSNCPIDSNIVASISKQSGNWRLVLRNRWDEEVILDQDFNIVSMQQLTQPKQ